MNNIIDFGSEKLLKDARMFARDMFDPEYGPDIDWNEYWYSDKCICINTDKYEKAFNDEYNLLLEISRSPMSEMLMDLYTR